MDGRSRFLLTAPTAPLPLPPTDRVSRAREIAQRNLPRAPSIPRAPREDALSAPAVPGAEMFFALIDTTATAAYYGLPPISLYELVPASTPRLQVSAQKKTAQMKAADVDEEMKIF